MMMDDLEPASNLVKLRQLSRTKPSEMNLIGSFKADASRLSLDFSLTRAFRNNAGDDGDHPVSLTRKGTLQKLQKLVDIFRPDSRVQARTLTKGTTSVTFSGKTYVIRPFYADHEAAIKAQLEATSKRKGKAIRLDEVDWETPIEQIALPGTATYIACGDNTVCVIEQGDLYVSGAKNLDHNIIGVPEALEQGPGLYSTISVDGEFVSMVSSGTAHSACITASGVLYAWGSNVLQPGQVDVSSFSQQSFCFFFSLVFHRPATCA